MDIVQQQYKQGTWRYTSGDEAQSDASFVLACGGITQNASSGVYCELRYQAMTITTITEVV